MPKDPAFLFYTKDFLSGVSDLTMEERGQYITLLCLQQQKGHLTEKAIKIAVGNAAADVMAKFRQDSAGLWYNERLELEIEKRASHAEKQRQRAIDGWQKRKKEAEKAYSGIHSGNAAALPLGNANANANGNEDNNSKGVDFSKPDIEGDEVIFPLDTQTVRELWAGWKRYRWDVNGDRYKMHGEQAALRQLEGMTFDEIKSTIEKAIQGGWKNLYPEKNGRRGTNKKQQQSIDTRQYLKEYYGNKFAAK